LIDLKINVVCVGIKHPGNLGAIARLCDNYGAKHLILVDPDCEINDVAYERAVKGRKYLDGVIIVDRLEDTRDYVDYLVALSARTGGSKNLTRSPIAIQELPDMVSDKEGRIGFVLGRENFGLHNDEVSQCDILCFIPTPGPNQVFNISHALSVALWELVREWDFEQPVEHRMMSADEKQAFFNFLEQILDYTRLREEQYYGVIQSFQSILNRAVMTQREANTVIGSFRAILQRLENPDAVWD
jgi:TrmH family RNA methyltransferase